MFTFYLENAQARSHGKAWTAMPPNFVVSTKICYIIKTNLAPLKMCFSQPGYGPEYVAVLDSYS